jgi:hypothetical protein
MSSVSTPEDLTGRSFGKWKVLSFSHTKLTKDNRKRHHWVCECKCGQVRTIVQYRLTGGYSTMCKPCGQKKGSKGATKHGNARREGWSRTYRSWKSMRARCYNPRTNHYSYYGGRGITVCPRWRWSFKNFLADMGERPSDRTLDRIDSDGNYEPGNCQWATKKEQTANRRKS